MMWLLLACVGSPSESGVADACAEVPVVTWDTFGEAFLIHNCNGCHAEAAPYRYGAPENVHFDTVEQAWAWSATILEVAGGDSPRMPPRGGVSDDDRQRLAWWLSCAEPGT